MKEENKYIGDDNFQKLLDHYGCPTPLNVIKMKFAGAVCSPNLELRPADVISSFWEDGKTPRLETKNEADLFFKYFMGLWDEIFASVVANKIKLSKADIGNKDNFVDSCIVRVMEIEFGYNEGFWGGKEDLNIPAFIAEIVDNLSELAGVYNKLAESAEKSEDITDIKNQFTYTDKMVEKAISFIIENYVLQRAEDLKRAMN
jgi:hypothetical protein